jgi:ornithine cyclodeaminase/alanine dehydrogenase-like protein (mu-crystallin family)
MRRRFRSTDLLSPGHLVSHASLLLSRADVRAFLDMDSCIAAVEAAFRAQADGATLPAGVLGTRARDGGFHVKAAGLMRGHAYYAAKINANFAGNPARHGLPTIQGVVALFDATNGMLLALMDSMEITTLRTAAATAVAAKYLAREEACTAAILGCGVQGRSQLRALSRVRRIERVYAWDGAPNAAAWYAREMATELGCEVVPTDGYRDVAGRCDVIITCTAAEHPLLGNDDVSAGTFVAGVGADSENKQELAPELLARSTLVVDVLDQCARIGDLHHALDAGAVTRDDVHAELADVVSGRRPGRRSADEVTVFDSTGTALEDVAAGAMVYERALAAGHARRIALGE